MDHTYFSPNHPSPPPPLTGLLRGTSPHPPNGQALAVLHQMAIWPAHTGASWRRREKTINHGIALDVTRRQLVELVALSTEPLSDRCGFSACDTAVLALDGKIWTIWNGSLLRKSNAEWCRARTDLTKTKTSPLTMNIHGIMEVVLKASACVELYRLARIPDGRKVTGHYFSAVWPRSKRRINFFFDRQWNNTDLYRIPMCFYLNIFLLIVSSQVILYAIFSHPSP